ncbi:histidine phosphatase family protein [Streptomyces lunaelactis]|uniref:histidine phosphatase family protein n=1 Tax=Streptomyces lunaelactis TaxID=1535768 RepID=UPI001585446D|nr:histidine phosphatase family protein [Streptomyces lunaelactis]NUL21825.1 histidine phosphatase family protein [Streptomyces lunaelactis]
MKTHILRHGQTEYSTKHLVNGDSSVPVQLSEEGVRSCQRAWTVLPLHSVRTWVASGFPRAKQTALLLTGVPAAELVVEPRLNELDYGEFEGGPWLGYGDWLDQHGAWRRPAGAAESQREGIRRMLLGLKDCLALPGPRLVVGHGLLLSVLLWQQGRSEGEAVPLFFPEAPCVQPLDVADDMLGGWIAELLSDLDTEGRQDPDERGDAAI